LHNGVDLSGAHFSRQLSSGAVLGIRPGEGSLAWLFFLYFLLLATCHYIGKSVRNSTYVDIVDATNLPYAYLLVAVVSFPVLVLYSKTASRFSQRSLIAAFCVVQASGLTLFVWLYSFDQKWVPITFYVWSTVAFSVGLSQFWSYANHVFDARQARRLFAFVGAGGLLGAIPGGQIASLAGRYGGTRWALLIAAVLSLIIIVVTRLIERIQPPREPTQRQAQLTLERLREARGGLNTLLGSRLLALIALLMMVAMVVNSMVDLQFSWVIQENTQELHERTRVFGNFFTLMGVIGFLFQIVFTQRIHRALGVAFGMRVLPVTVGIASIPLVLAFGAGVAAPIWAAYAVKLCENGFRHSVEQSTRELLFMPVPQQLRIRAKAFIDIFVQRFAKGIAAVALLPISLGLLSVQHLSWLIVLVVAVWLWITAAARREYVHAFREGLKPGVAADAPSIDLGDAATLSTLVESLGSSDPRQVVHSLQLLAAHRHERLVPPVLLHHESAEVRCRTLEVLAAAGRRDAAPLIERAITDDDRQVRSTAIQALANLQGEEVSELMSARLSDPDPKIRSAAVASLILGSDPELKTRAMAALQAMLSDGDRSVRVEAARALGDIDDPEGSHSLVQLLYDGEQEVVREAMSAIRSRMERGNPNPLYVPTLISLMGNRRLKRAARDAVVAYGEEAIEALVMFMNAEEEQIWVRRAVPMTVALIGSPRSAEGLVDSLMVRDGFLRSKVIGALAYLRGRHPEISFKVPTVAEQIRLEARWYLRSFADLCAVSSIHEAQFDGPYARWRASGRVPSLLQQTLANRMVIAVDNIFGLLQLIHPGRHVQAAYRSLMSGNPALRATALEFLDNTLTGSVRRDVFAVIDDAPAEVKLHKATQLFGTTAQAPDETIGRLLRGDPGVDPASVHLTFAAIHAVYADRMEEHYPELRAIAERHESPLLAETAQWALSRIGFAYETAAVEIGTSNASGVVDERGGRAVRQMAQIEKVVFLQGVELFGSCTAEQLLQLAEIATDRQLDADERVFDQNEAATAMYCVVDGTIDLSSSDHSSLAVERGETFGVIDILSGQLRTRSAKAETPSRVLEIEAEDLFDLLSLNIEIVRGLFKQLTRSTGDSQRGLL
jgi:AAA family ATP:ADP antiporter